MKLQGWFRRLNSRTGNLFIDALKSETEKKKRRQRKKTIVKEVTDRFFGVQEDENDMRKMRRSLMDQEDLEKHDSDLDECARVFAEVMTRFGFIIEDTSNRIARLIMEVNSLQHDHARGGKESRRASFDSEEGGAHSKAHSRRPSMAQLMLDSL